MADDGVLDESIARQFLDKGGRWQMIQILLLLFSYISTSFQVMTIVVIGFQPKYDCMEMTEMHNRTNGLNFEDKCEIYNTTTNTSKSCSSYVYNVQKHESIVSEMDLICDNGYLAETSQLLYTVGMAVGSFIVSPLSDRFGRRWSFLILRAVYPFCAFGLAVIPNIIGFMCLRFLTGTIGMALSLVRFVFIMELSTVKMRPLLGVGTGVIWAVNLCFLALIAHLLRGHSWRILQAVISIPSLSVILEAIFMRESLLWLYANNRAGEATKLLRNAMKVNKVSVKSLQEQSGLELENFQKASNNGTIKNGTGTVGKVQTLSNQTYEKKLSEEKNVVESSIQDNKRISALDIIKNKTSRILALMIAFTWFVNSLVYYGIFFMSNDLAGDRILNFFLNSVVEIPANVLLYFVLKFFGRKKPLVGIHGLCAVSLISGGILMATLENNTKDVVMLVVSIVGKFGISATFSLIYVYTTEVFPTNFRASGLGLGSTSARLGSFMSPFSGVLARKLEWGPGGIFGGLCAIVTFILCWAPETADRNLPQTIEDMEVTKKKSETKNKHVDKAIDVHM